MRVASTRTCRKRRASAGATGFVRGCVDVPRAAAAAAAAPSSAVRAAGFWVLAPSCAGAGALSSRCARAALALRSRLATHTPASGEPAPWAVHGDGGSSPSSSLPSSCHCAVVIHSKLGLPHYRPSPPLQSLPTRTPRGLAARGVPARARRARAMGMPASRALRLRRRLRRRRLLARRLLGVGVLVRWRAACCARAARVLRSRCWLALGSHWAGSRWAGAGLALGSRAGPARAGRGGARARWALGGSRALGVKIQPFPGADQICTYSLGRRFPLDFAPRLLPKTHVLSSQMLFVSLGPWFRVSWFLFQGLQRVLLSLCK